MTARTLHGMADLVRRFNEEIVGIEVPPEPTRLGPQRKRHAVGHLLEEVGEFRDAETLVDEADAIIDLVYVALGRLVEMGLTVSPLFEEVHRANMARARGDNARRPHSGGLDAVKPDGWRPPDLAPYLTVTRAELDWLLEQRAAAAMYHGPGSGPAPAPVETSPKILVIGHARHGKDTVCEILRDEYGLRFTSSSLFCAGRVIMPLLESEVAAHAFLIGLGAERGPAMARELQAMREKWYASTEACFGDRANHRALWFEAISAFNSPDPTSLARAILAENDVYCGIRSSLELLACQNAGLFDLTIWVDASGRGIPPEDRSSCTVGSWMADRVVDNSGSLADLRKGVKRLMDNALGRTA